MKYFSFDSQLLLEFYQNRSNLSIAMKNNKIFFFSILMSLAIVIVVSEPDTEADTETETETENDPGLESKLN